MSERQRKIVKLACAAALLFPYYIKLRRDEKGRAKELTLRSLVWSLSLDLHEREDGEPHGFKLNV